jgi:hypothetical protein
MEEERSSGAVGFCSSDGSPARNVGFPMVLLLRGPKKVERRGLIEENFGRGALTPKGAGDGRVPVRRRAAGPETYTVSSG